MNSQAIRSSFLEFFGDRAHQRVASSPLVPHGDPTLLFVNAGMVPFKNSFLGIEPPPAPRAVSVQRCLRVSGKHNDLENVGPSPRHHTFFEMLGNFSFGDYFKEDAIRFAWELITEGWQMPVDHLFATVYEEDDEAEALWGKLSTLPPERILRCGAKDNFWSMGETGPCGPSSELHIDLTPNLPQIPWDEGTESGRYLEFWNLVFMQFDRNEAGELTPLPNPSIDTGAGLERVAAILQGVDSNYDTDLFQPILAATAELAKTRYGADDRADVSMRVIADHLRAVTFLLADGVIPGNEGRGYVLRRVLRRAVRHGMSLGFEEPFMHRLVPIVGEIMGDGFDQLAATREASVATLETEESKFLSTVAGAARQVQDEIETARRDGGHSLAGDVIFRLYDTYGLPIDVLREIAEEEQFGLDEKGFEQALDAQRSRSRQASGTSQKRLKALANVLLASGDVPETAFEGYENLEASGVTVLRMAGLDAEPPVLADRLEAGGEAVVVLDRTVFYAEGGGQVGDRGVIAWAGGKAQVHNTLKGDAGVSFHFVEVVEGALEVGAKVDLRVDGERRPATERNHTATHLLHAALHQIVGSGARQAGSLVAPDRLRFDFTAGQPLTDEERRSIETQVNAWIRQADPVRIEEMDREAALDGGAMALFGEKYGDRVRTVGVGNHSFELCGGCHVANTGEIGLFLITAERGIASGVRRIEAVTGSEALERVRRADDVLSRLEQSLGVPPERIADEVASLRAEIKERDRELAKLRMELVSGAVGAGDSDGEIEVEGIKLVVKEVPPAPANEMRNMADTLRSKLGSGVVVLGSRDGEKVGLVVAVSDDLKGRAHAGKLVKELAGRVGGGGGGRPEFAQAGGRKPDELPAALEAVPDLLREQIS